ncbi:FixH family protein [Sagittula sp. SSi028]|uniref:FixH family protein n=1 Tax=Sagittula sp. SSi028 TaxID=3400636 RepID=UPI003AF65E1B
MTTLPQTTEFRIKGWHVLTGFVAAFGIIIAVNVTLAVNAVRSFPGVETDNSYLASQTFDSRRDAQLELGWDVAARHDGQRLILSINNAKGYPVRVPDLQATLGRPTNVADDLLPVFDWDGSAYVAELSLPAGNWDLWIKARADDGTMFQQRLTVAMTR